MVPHLAILGGMPFSKLFISTDVIVEKQNHESEGREWGVGSVVAEFRVFSGAPIFSPEAPKYLPLGPEVLYYIASLFLN